MNNFSLKLSYFLFLISFQISAIADCIQDNPDRYNFSGKYVNITNRIYLKSSDKIHKCKYLSFSEKKTLKSDDFNIWCSNNLLIRMEDPNPSLNGITSLNKNNYAFNRNIEIKFKGSEYNASALYNKTKGSQKIWYENTEKCYSNYRESVTLVDYKLDYHEKQFTLAIYSKADIISGN